MVLNIEHNIGDILWAYNIISNKVEQRKICGIILGTNNIRNIKDEVLYDAYKYIEENEVGDEINVIRGTFIYRSCELFDNETDANEYKEDMQPLWEASVEAREEKRNEYLRKLEEMKNPQSSDDVNNEDPNNNETPNDGESNETPNNEGTEGGE